MLNAVYAMVTEGATGEDRHRIDAILSAPLDGRRRSTDAARRMAAFGAIGRAEVVR